MSFDVDKLFREDGNLNRSPKVFSKEEGFIKFNGVDVPEYIFKELSNEDEKNHLVNLFNKVELKFDDDFKCFEWCLKIVKGRGD